MTTKQIQSGDFAPDFSLPSQTGAMVTLFELLYRGPVVLYFYPKDLTSGCTLEAQNFRDLYQAFQSHQCQVFGISKDTAASHQKFITQECLPFDLLTDADGSVCQAYGVWKQKSMYGKTYFGIERSTFFITIDGRIGNVWRNVSVSDHVKQVLDVVSAQKVIS